jgi:hypothetical protein
MLELISSAEITQLHLHHGAEISRGVVMVFEDFTKVALEEHDHAFS